MPYTKDRKYYIYKLSTNPVFFIRNFRILLGKVLEHLSNKVKIKLQSKHYGLKSRPSWLILIDKVSKCEHKPSLRFCLPTYPVANQFYSIKYQSEFLGLQVDQEVYFRENRWGFLIEALLVGGGDLDIHLLQVQDWMRLHSDKGEDAWEVYSSCERVSNLLVYLSTIDLTLIKSEFQMLAIDFITDSLNWIYRNLEYYGPAKTNNHILNNARALIIGGVATDSDSFYNVGMQLFRKLLPELIDADGFLRERSSHYQLLVTNWVLDALKFAEGRRNVCHDDIQYLNDYAEQMVLASVMLCDSDGFLLGFIGDISPDINPRFTSARLAKLYPEKWGPLKLDQEFSAIKGGWFRLSKNHQHILGNFPCGAYPSEFPTHGHSDHTGFIWAYKDVDILIDAGRYRYTPDAISLHQKSCQGHNILMVDGFSPVSDSLVLNGQWCPQSYADAYLTSFISNSVIQLTHNGFSRSTNVLDHIRVIALEESGLNIIDSLDGVGPAQIELRWNFGPDFNEIDEKLMQIKSESIVIQLKSSCIKEFNRVESGRMTIEGGWFSSDYGQVIPVIALTISFSVYLPAKIYSHFEIIKCAE
jgi:hypothetical protein